MSSEHHFRLRACRWFLTAVLLAVVLAACVQVDDQRGGSAPPPASLGGVDANDPQVGGGIGDPDSPLLATASVLAEPAPTDDSPRPDGAEVMPTRPTPEPTATVPLAVVVTPTPEPVVEEPTATAPAEATAEPEAEPTAEPTTVATEAPAVPTVPSVPTVHVVAPGENLYRIGERYGLSWTAIAELNGITNPDQIVVGQELRLSAAAPDTGVPPAEPVAGEPPAAPEPESSAPVSTHTVRPGDSVYRLSQLYGVSWVEIAEANGLTTPNQIYVGQVLKIPVSRPGPTPEFTHVVRGGETLYRIALQYGVAQAALAEANGLQAPYVIYPGQTLVIPTGTD